MLPNDVASDPRLTATDLRVLAALLYFAKQDPSCYPSDFSLGKRTCKHPSTIRRSLHRLETLGYIHRTFFPATRANPTGRLIYLCFVAPDWPRPPQPRVQARASGPEVTPAHRCAATPKAPTPMPVATPRTAAREGRALLRGTPAHRCTSTLEFPNQKFVTFTTKRLPILQRPLTPLPLPYHSPAGSRPLPYRLVPPPWPL